MLQDLDEFLEHPREIGATSLCCLATQPTSTADTFRGIGMPDHPEFAKFLEHQVCRYRGILENLFDPCDRRFIFGSIKKSTDQDDVPHTNFPNGLHFNGECVVDIHISEWPWQQCCRDQGTWQVAHESVHLLDPGVGGTATFLEEG